MDNVSMAGSFKCYDCEEDECGQPEDQLGTCKNATYCWKSTNREDDGTVHNNRGCFDSYMAMRIACKGKSDSDYHIECCQTELCNGGAFPALQPVGWEQGTNAAATGIIVFFSMFVTLLATFFALLGLIMFWSPCLDEPVQENEPNNEASQPSGSRNVEQLELGVISTDDSALTRGRPNQPTASDSESSPAAGSSTDAGICSSNSLHQLGLNAAPAGYDERVLVLESYGSFTDIATQKRS